MAAIGIYTHSQSRTLDLTLAYTVQCSPILLLKLVGMSIKNADDSKKQISIFRYILIANMLESAQSCDD